MKITTQGNGIKIGERLQKKITDKISKFSKYFGDEGTMNVRIRPEGKKYVVELTLKADGKIYRAEAVDEEILNAVDKTVDKLESQIRKILRSLTCLKMTMQLILTSRMKLKQRSQDVRSLI